MYDFRFTTVVANCSFLLPPLCVFKSLLFLVLKLKAFLSIVWNTQVTVILAYLERELKTLQMSIVLSFSTRRRYAMTWFISYFLQLLIFFFSLTFSFYPLWKSFSMYARAYIPCSGLINVLFWLLCSYIHSFLKVELVEGGTFWLSDSPSIPGSISWKAVAPCIATWVISLILPFSLSSQSLFSNVFLWRDTHTFQLKGVEPPGFSFQIVNTNMDEFSPRARRRGALLTWQHIASLPPSLPVLYCGGFNTKKESTTGRFLLGRSR